MEQMEGVDAEKRWTNPPSPEHGRLLEDIQEKTTNIDIGAQRMGDGWRATQRERERERRSEREKEKEEDREEEREKEREGEKKRKREKEKKRKREKEKKRKRE